MPVANIKGSRLFLKPDAIAIVEKRSDAQAMFRCDNYPDRDINGSNLH